MARIVVVCFSRQTHLRGGDLLTTDHYPPQNPGRPRQWLCVQPGQEIHGRADERELFESPPDSKTGSFQKLI